jgi:hypothetical protein
MKKASPESTASYRKVLSLLDLHRRALQLAGASPEVLSTYSRIVDFLRGLSPSQIEGLGELKTAPTFSKKLIEGSRLESLSLEEIEKIVADDKSPRRVLERIAISRFHVPKGSMRSFQNVEMLREKILIRIQNERTHRAIGELASTSRGQK